MTRSLRNVRKNIRFNRDTWENNRDTNCYSYALGLDIKEQEISTQLPPYYLGYLYAIYNCSLTDFQKAFDFLENYSHEERIALDLKMLKIAYEEIDLYEKIKKENERKIAFFKSEKIINYELAYGESSIMCPTWYRFHFYVQDNHGIWTHKPGYNSYPTYYSERSMSMIDSLEDIKNSYPNFEYQQTLRLRLKN